MQISNYPEFVRHIASFINLLILSVVCRVSELLEGKGGGKKRRYQGKANRMSKRSEVEKLLQEYVASL